MAESISLQDASVAYVQRDWGVIANALEQGISPKAWDRMPIPLLDWVWSGTQDFQNEANWDEVHRLMQALGRRGEPLSAWTSDPAAAFFRHWAEALIEANNAGVVPSSDHVADLEVWLNLGLSVDARHTNGRHALAHGMESTTLKFASVEARQLMADWAQVVLTRSQDERPYWTELSAGQAYPEFAGAWHQALSLRRARALSPRSTEPSVLPRSRYRG